MMEHSDLFPVIGGGLNLTAALVSLITSVRVQRRAKRDAPADPQNPSTTPGPCEQL